VALVGLSVLASGVGIASTVWADETVTTLPTPAAATVDNGADLAVYGSQSTSAAVIDWLPDGTVLSVTGYSDNWLQVEADGFSPGFVEAAAVWVPVMSVSTNPIMDLSVGALEMIEYDIYPPCASDLSVTWHSDNPAVATFDGLGQLTALAVGTAWLTVITGDGSWTTTTLLTVVDDSACTVKLSAPMEIPDQIAKGKNLTLSGAVRSYGCRLRSVTIEIVASTLKQTAEVHMSFFQLSSVDARFKFSSLALGSYRFQVTATDATGQIWLLQDDPFEVVSQVCQLTLVGPTVVPSQHLLAKALALKGVIKAVGCQISSVSATIIGDSASESASVNGEIFNLAQWGPNFAFQELEIGSYQLEVTAIDSRGKLWTLQRAVFDVVKQRSCIVTLTDPTTLPDYYEQGDDLFISGTVKATYCTLTKVSAKIARVGGKTVYSKAIKKKATSFNLSRWQSKIRFSSLSPGQYRLTVTATSSKKKTTTLQSAILTVQPSVSCLPYAQAKLAGAQRPLPSGAVGARTVAAFVEIARSQVGYRDGIYRSASCVKSPFNGHWTKYGMSQGWGKTSHAWCAAFVSWVAQKAGMRGSSVPNYVNTKVGYRWFKAKQRFYSVADVKAGRYRPKPGDVVFFGESVSTLRHTGIVLSWDGATTVTTIEGNTPNPDSPLRAVGVFEKTRPFADIVLPIYGFGSTK